MSEESRGRLRELLDKPRFKKAVIEALQMNRGPAASRDDVSFEEADLPDRLWQDLHATYALRGLFETSILAKLPKPQSVTVEDLISTARSQLGGIADTVAFEAAYTRFVEYVLFLPDVAMIQLGGFGENALQDDERAVSKRFDLGCWTPSTDEEIVDTSYFWKLWDSDLESGYSFVVVWDPNEQINGYLRADASRDAFEAAECTFRMLMRSVLRSFGILANVVAGEVFLSFVGEEYSPKLSFPLLVSDLGMEFFSGCISGYFAPRSKKGATMEQRIGNSVRLLMEADSQRSSSISLALSFAAIEAIVCRNTQGITDELSRNVATALEPDRSRRKAAIDATKVLYVKRSKALHGEAIEEDETAWRRTRFLAAGVLSAAIQWLRYQQRMDDRDEQTEFVSHLKEAGISGSQIIGVQEELRNCLPIS